MDYMQRHKRVRQLVKKVNQQRKRQALKIDILCNDFIGAQRNFIKNLDAISFASLFYESLLGANDISTLLYTAGKLIKQKIPEINIAFLLRRTDNFDLHILENDEPITLDKQRLENCFTNELVNDICQANKVCSLDDLFAMGMGGNPTWLNKISAVTIPIARSGLSAGFILLYRNSENKITTAEVNNISAVTGGLYKAISSCQVPSQTSD